MVVAFARKDAEGPRPWMFRNVLGVPDTHAPDLHQVTVQGAKPNGTPTVMENSPADVLPVWVEHQYVPAGVSVYW